MTITVSDSLQLLEQRRVNLQSAHRQDQVNISEFTKPKVPTNKRKSLESGVYYRTRQAGHSGRYEPRFKPPRELLPSGKPLIHDHLPLGGYETQEDAKIVRQIAAFYYGKAEPHLDLGDGRQFPIDSSTTEHLDVLRGKEKRKWVASRAKEVFQEFKKAKDSSGLLNATSNHTNVIPSGEQIANACDPSHSGFSSPTIYKSPENLESSSKATLPVASNPDEQWCAELPLDEGDGAVNGKLLENLPVAHDLNEPTCSFPGLLENTELLGACLEDFPVTVKELLEKNGSWLDFLSSLPDSGFNANGHPEYSAVNATTNELRASLFEPDEPCSPVVEVTTPKENEESSVEAAIPAKVSLDITAAPVDGALPTSQGLQNGMDVGAPLSDPRFCSKFSTEDHLFKSFYQQKFEIDTRKISELECERESDKRRISELERENDKRRIFELECERENDKRRISELECERENDKRRISELECENYKRRISELECEVKRLKGKSPMSFDAYNTSQPSYRSP